MSSEFHPWHGGTMTGFGFACSRRSAAKASRSPRSERSSRPRCSSASFNDCNAFATCESDTSQKQINLKSI